MNGDWKLARLGDVLRSVSRPVRLSPESAYRLVGAHWYAKGLYVKEQKSGGEIQAKILFEVKKGDFVYNRLFAWKGSFAVASEEVDGCFVSNEFPCFVPLDAVDPKFLWLYFSRSGAWSEALGLSSGSTPTSRNRLKEEQFLNMEVRLPPVDDQRAIVSRIEELAAKTAEARLLRSQAAEQADRFLTRVSARVFAGHSYKTEPLGELVEKKTGVAYKAEDFSLDDGVPVVRLKEIQSKSPSVYLRSPEKYPNVWLKAGDIILAKTSFSTGAMCIWPGPEAVLNQNAIMLRATSGLNQRFLFFWLQHQVSEFLQHQLADPNFYPYIRESDIVAWKVPVPTLVEQRRTVDYLDDIHIRVDALKKIQSETAAELDALMPSILSKAFRGEL